MASTMRYLLPAILGDGVTYNLHPHNGKQSLLRNLPNRLRGYAKWVGETNRLIVVLDRDDDDCVALKEELERLAAEAGMSTASVTERRSGQVINRLAGNRSRSFQKFVEGVRFLVSGAA